MTAATADSPVRRSRREKRQAHTVYDDARNSLGSTTTKTSTTAPQSLSTTASSKSRSRQSGQKVKRVTITRNEKKKRTRYVTYHDDMKHGIHIMSLFSPSSHVTFSLIPQ